MSKLKTAVTLLKKPGDIILPLAAYGVFNWMADDKYLKMAYRCVLRKKLNLNNPVSFTEKIQWLKLYDRKDIYINYVDKILVKEYVAQKIGSEYVIPLLGTWNNTDEIPFDTLPNQFVLKCNHDSGSTIVCRDKFKFNISDAKKKLDAHMSSHTYDMGREWPYKLVKRRILAEAYLEEHENSLEDLVDYKFYCFNGIPTFCQVISSRSTDEKIDFYDMQWRIQPFVGLAPFTTNSNIKRTEPHNFDKMKLFSERLSENLCFSRIDFYEVNKKLFFGEITLYPRSGFGWFNPPEWDLRLGNMIDLSPVMKQVQKRRSYDKK